MNETQALRALTPVLYAGSDTSPVGRDYKPLVIAPHLSYPADRIASPDSGEIFLLQGVVDIFTQAREKIGVPLIVASGYRTLAWQDYLRRKGLKASKRSPHCCGAAFDVHLDYIKADSWCKRAQLLINHLCEAARNLGLREYLRYGFRTYGCGFVHFDIVPLLFDPQWKKVAEEQLADWLERFYPYGRKNPCPANWRKDARPW